MKTESFHSRIPAWVFGIGFAACAFNLVYELRSAMSEEFGGAVVLNIVAAAFLTSFFGMALRNRMRSPVVEISDDAIEFGPTFRFVRARRRIPLDQISEVVAGGDDRIVLRTSAGRDFELPLLEVSRSERGAVRSAISDRLGAG